MCHQPYSHVRLHKFARSVHEECQEKTVGLGFYVNLCMCRYMCVCVCVCVCVCHRSAECHMSADPSLDPVTPPLTFHLSFSPTTRLLISSLSFCKTITREKVLISSGQQLLANMTSDNRQLGDGHSQGVAMIGVTPHCLLHIPPFRQGFGF